MKLRDTREHNDTFTGKIYTHVVTASVSTRAISLLIRNVISDYQGLSIVFATVSQYVWLIFNVLIVALMVSFFINRKYLDLKFSRKQMKYIIGMALLMVLLAFADNNS